jgi:hypothetical protein
VRLTLLPQRWGTEFLQTPASTYHITQPHTFQKTAILIFTAMTTPNLTNLNTVTILWSVTTDGVWIGNRIIAHLHTQLVTISNDSTVANSHSAHHCSTHLSLLRLLHFHRSLPGNSFQYWTFPLLWVPVLSLCLSYQLLTATTHKD